MKIYHNPRCSKSRQALALLERAGVEVDVVEYLRNPPSVAELDRLLKRLELSPQDLMRRGETVFRDLGLADRSLSRKEALRILVENPRLIQRPIVDNGNKAVVARPPERVQELL